MSISSVSAADSELASKRTEFSTLLIQKISIPNKVAQFVHDLIISCELKPVDRVVEWRVTKRLGIGHSKGRPSPILSRRST